VLHGDNVDVTRQCFILHASLGNGNNHVGHDDHHKQDYSGDDKEEHPAGLDHVQEFQVIVRSSNQSHNHQNACCLNDYHPNYGHRLVAPLVIWSVLSGIEH
jgi:hypothetical protein